MKKKEGEIKDNNNSNNNKIIIIIIVIIINFLFLRNVIITVG